jgi:hypothetical protein
VSISATRILREKKKIFFVFCTIFSQNKSQGSSVRIEIGYRLDDRGSGFDFRRGLGIFLFSTVFRPALGPTQPPIQWVPGAPSLEVNQPQREANHSPPSSVEEFVTYLHPTIRLHGVVLGEAQGNLYF